MLLVTSTAVYATTIAQQKFLDPVVDLHDMRFKEVLQFNGNVWVMIRFLWLTAWFPFKSDAVNSSIFNGDF